MKVYDFDKTIYKKDSTLEFFKFSLKKKPSLLFFLPGQLIYLIGWKLNFVSKETFKEKFYRFLKNIDDIDGYVSLFWNKEIKNIEKWYLRQQDPTDVIISASPEFLLEPICQKIGITYLISSKVNKLSGILEGPNCYGEEKVKRFEDEFGNAKISEFYSDSLSDLPLGKKANNFFLVKKGSIELWK